MRLIEDAEARLKALVDSSTIDNANYAVINDYLVKTHNTLGNKPMPSWRSSVARAPGCGPEDAGSTPAASTHYR